MISVDFLLIMANNKIKRSIFLIGLSCHFFFISSSYSDTDTLLQGQQLLDGKHLVSADGSFSLGFFSPGTSKKRYLGIWYNIQDEEKVTLFAGRKVVWVANRNIPISDRSGMLMIDESGKLKISYNGGSLIVWNSTKSAGNTSATLLNSGNLVLKEMNSNGSTRQVLGQSFDYPTDTLLPGMKLGMNLKTGYLWLLTSWISENNPAEGSFRLSIGVGINESSQLIIWWKRSVYWTSGVWQNGRFEFLPWLSNEGYPNFSYVSNEDEKYFTYSMINSQTLSRYMLDPKGVVAELKGVAPFGACSYKFDRGCVQQKLPECRNQNEQYEARKGFMSIQGLKFDESYHLSLFDCKAACLNNCSCVAYAFFTSDNDTGCEIWSQGVSFSENIIEGREIYLLHSKKGRWWIWLMVAAAGLAAVPPLYFIYYFIQRKMKEGSNEIEEEMLLCELVADTTNFRQHRNLNKLKRDEKKGHELQFFSFESIASATNNFASTNKLGEGGFGAVYKGELRYGQEIAVKRLAIGSGQGLAEFRNEIVLIAKLQHTNLVKLVGCCVQREEKMLIYEYMPNKSLDSFLFDPAKKKLLDWNKRLNIIEGIAQGLLYLHKYSRLRIIHRDLKASNILLDEEMNPKISDFGMARIFRKNETEANTNRIVGTHGYMSAEYALKGIVSMKIDVFSFGVLLLEIISGKKNNSCSHSDLPLSLIGYAWQLWNDGRALDLLDSVLHESCCRFEAERCIHVSLLCVQDQATDRPTMENVASMLKNEALPLIAPKQPVYFVNPVGEEAEEPENKSKNCSINNVSISVMEAR